MTAPASKLLRIPFRARADWCMPVSVTALGIVGLLDDFWLLRDPAAVAALHALFGLSLAALVIVRFTTRMHAITSPCMRDIRATARNLSRMVYLLLAILVVFKEFAGSSIEDLHDDLAYSLAALALIRVLALRYWLAIRRTSQR
jgi:hypothetical protein